MKNFSSIIWGVIIILVGVIWMLNSLEIASINLLFNGWWTLFIIVPSIIGIVKKPKDWSGYIFLCIGVLLLLGVRGIVSFDILGKIFAPAICILIGLSVIFKGATDNNVENNIKKIDKDGLEIYSATFSSRNITLNGDEFKNANLDSTFGSIKFDISNCEIKEDMVISASSIFSGIEIIVPKGVNVKVKSNGIFGGTDCKVKNLSENQNTIYVDSLALFGGVDIK